MDPVERSFCVDLWNDLLDCLTLKNKEAALFDYLSGELHDVKIEQLRILSNQNREKSLAIIRDALKCRRNGFDILLQFVDRDDYKHLHRKYTNRKQEEVAIREECNRALRAGYIPSEPRFYIQRRNKLNIIKEKLMSDHSERIKINVFGLSGMGKTQLAAACARDRDILKRTKYKIFWVDMQHDKDVIRYVHALYHRIQHLDPGSAPRKNKLPTDLELMKNMLQGVFLKPAYKAALIVLDNVSVSEHIRHFDVCRLLVLSQERLQLDEAMLVVPLKENFSDDETRELFERALDAPLPRNEHVDELVTWCRGDPLTAVLCGSAIEVQRPKLSASDAVAAWETFNRSIAHTASKRADPRKHVIQLTVKGLPEDLRKRFIELAVYPPEVNISSKALAVIWEMEEWDAEKVMMELSNKSLVEGVYNELARTYVYGMHHAVCAYLKDVVKSNMAAKHVELVRKYRKKYGDYHQIADDNYMYQYLGYHLRAGGLTNQFHVFLDNLNFIEAKIRAAGIGDVLHDLYEYHLEIGLYTNEGTHMLGFLEYHGQHLEQYPHTSIIQSALQLPREDPIYQLALCEVEKERSRLYFESLVAEKNKCYVLELNVGGDFHVACFIGDMGYVLIGTEGGEIQLWCQRYNQKKSSFCGHKSAIRFLRADAPEDDGTINFLSVSEDGEIRIWKQRFTSDVVATYSDHASPALKQKNFQSFFGESHSMRAHLDFQPSVNDAFLTADLRDDLVVAGSRCGKVVLWCAGRERFTNDVKQPIASVQFSENAKHVFVAATTTVFLYNTDTGAFILNICCKLDILALHTVFTDTSDDEFVVVQAHQVNKYTIKWRQQMPSYEATTVMALEDAKYACSSMTDKYLVVGSDDRRVHMWDLQKQQLIEQFDAQYGNVICIDAITHKMDNLIEILLTGFDNGKLKLWNIIPDDEESESFVEHYAAHWLDDCFEVAVARGATLTTMKNNEKFLEISVGACVTKVVTKRNIFAYGTAGGQVFMLYTRTPMIIMNLPAGVCYLEAFDDMIVAASVDGSLGVYYASKEITLEHAFSSASGEAAIRTDCIRKCFRLQDKLIVVSERYIGHWSPAKSKNIFEVLHAYPADEGGYQLACMIQKNCLCVTWGKNFMTFALDDSAHSSPMTNQAKDCITSCCCSQDGIYLALGTETGDIEIWTVEPLKFYTRLELHNTAVNFMQFSPKHHILLSLSEQIAWWNISLCVETSSRSDNRRRSMRSRSNSGASPGAKASLGRQLAALDLGDASMAMLAKCGRDDKKCLLSAIKLYGSTASHVVCSDNFQAFFVIDNLGNSFDLRVIV